MLYIYIYISIHTEREVVGFFFGGGGGGETVQQHEIITPQGLSEFKVVKSVVTVDCIFVPPRALRGTLGHREIRFLRLFGSP